MDLFNFLGFTAFGTFLGNVLTNVFSNRADTGLTALHGLLAAKLQDGRIPANHDLREAVDDALRQALRGLALALADNHLPASPFLQELRAKLLHPLDRNVPTNLMDVPFWTAQDSAERVWIDRFAALIEDADAIGRLAGQGLGDGIGGLLAENPAAGQGEPLSQAVKAWIDAELRGVPGRPVLLDDWLQTGWPVGEDRRIGLYQAWCWFFREAIKARPKVFNIYVAETLAELKQQLAAPRPERPVSLWERLGLRPQAQASITLTDFTDYLTAQSADLKNWLETRFDRFGKQLDGIAQTQAQHTGLLQNILSEIGGFPKLCRDSRRFRYGLVISIVLVLAGLSTVIVQNQKAPDKIAKAVQQHFDPAQVKARLVDEITHRFEQDKAQAVQAGQHYDTILQLEKQRDAALAKVDEVIATIEQGLVGKPDPVFVEASNILQREGADNALKYLEAHRADRQARNAHDKANAATAEEKLQQDAQTLFLEADLRQTRYEWDKATTALQEAAATAPHWWEARWRLGKLLRETAHYPEALPHLQAAVVLAEKDSDRAIAMNELANLFQKQSLWANAEPLYRRALAIYQKKFDLDNPVVSTYMNNLALLLAETNQPSKAETLMRRALAIDEKIYGPDHPAIAHDISNLSLLLQQTNRLAEAEPLMRRALAINEKTFGLEHPRVAINLSNLAMLLQDTTRSLEAEPLMRRALAIDKKSYGADHPAIARDLNNLAQLLQDMNRLEEAEPLMRQALAIDEKTYGLEHPIVAGSINNLATLLLATNRLAEAEPLMRRALAINEKSFGLEHPKVAINLSNLAILLHSTNRPAEAEPLMRRALAIAEKSHGAKHLDVATFLSGLALLLQTTNRLAEAEPLMRRSVLILLKSTHAAGHELPHLRDALIEYQNLLTAQKLKPAALAQRLDSLGPEAGYSEAEWAAMREAWKQP